MNCFFLTKLTFQHNLHKIYIAFYVLRSTYFSDVNVGRNILMNSLLKRILFISSDKKKWNNTETDRKNMEKENNTDESDFSEKEIPDLNSLNFFWIWTKISEISTVVRSSHQRCSVTKGVLRNFENFTGKNLCQCLFFNKDAGLSPATLLKKTLAQVFSCEFCKISKNTFSYRKPPDDCFLVVAVMMRKKVLNIK